MVRPFSEQISLLQAYWSRTSYTPTSGVTSDTIAAATLNAASVTGTPGGDASSSRVRGIVTVAPNNIVRIRNADDGYAVLSTNNYPIFGRITYAAGFYTISYLKLVSGSEVAATLPPVGGDFDLLFPEVMNFGEVPANAVLQDYGGFIFNYEGTETSGGGGGSQNLATTLMFGNITGGTDIELSNGDAIISSINLITLGDDVEVSGNVTTLGLILEEQSSTPFDPTGTTQGTLWVKDDNPNTLYYTDNDGYDHDLIRSDIPLKGTVTTSGTTTDVLLSYTLTDAYAVTIDMVITGRKDDGTQAGGFKITGTFRRSGATVTQVGSIAASFYESDDIGWSADLVINSTAIEVQVTGSTGDTVEWKGIGTAVLNKDL